MSEFDRQLSPGLPANGEVPGPGIAPGRTCATSRLAPRGVGTSVTGRAPLPTTARARFEAISDSDRSDARLHTDTSSTTTGGELGECVPASGPAHFGAGDQPDDPFGLHLLAHEVPSVPALTGSGGDVVQRAPLSAHRAMPAAQARDQTNASVEREERGERDSDREKPVLDKAGIGSAIAIDRFVGAAKEVQKNWNSLKAAERAKKLGAAANAELQAAGVCKVTTKLKDLDPAAGKFRFTTWELELDKDAFTAGSITEEKAADIGATVYHEARHAEQWHRMARVLAGQGKSAAAIKRELSIPAKVVRDAAEKPIKDHSPEGEEASRWYDSVYGTKRAERENLHKNIEPKYSALRADAIREHNKILADASATEEARDEAARKSKAAHDDYMREYYMKYRALPEESDAWATGDKVKAKYTEE